jgi:hypothetical protein
MYTRASVILVSATVLLFLAGLTHGAHDYPKVGNYFTIMARTEHCEALSKWDVVVLNRNMSQERPEILSTLRSMNADIELLTYYPVAAVWAGYDSMDTLARLYGQKVEACDWWLYDNKGNRVGDPEGSWFINFTTKCPQDEYGITVDQWLADFIADEILVGGPWDGILLDIMFENAWWLNNTDWFSEPPAMLDIDRDGTPDTPDSVYAWWRAGIISFLDRLRQNIGMSHVLVGNGKHCLSDYLNGGIRENFPYMHGGWEENMLSEYGYLTLCDELLDYPMQCVMMLCSWVDDGNTLYQPRRTVSYERFLRYTLCSALLGDGYYFLQGGSCNLWWEPYYDLDVGLPTSEAYPDSVWNLLYHRYSRVWRREFENATVFCNPYDDYISFDAGWLSPQDGLIRTHGAPTSVSVRILKQDNPTRTFNHGDSFLTRKIAISNYSENAVYAGVWARLSQDGVILASSGQAEYLVGAQDSTVKFRSLRLPATLSPGWYCLEVLVGGPDYVEVERDTMMVAKVIDFNKEQIKAGDDVGPGTVAVYPQPALLGREGVNVKVEPGGSTGGFCSVRLYDVKGRLLKAAFAGNVDGDAGLDVPLDLGAGMRLAPGVYFVSVVFDEKTFTRKMVVLRP